MKLMKMLEWARENGVRSLKIEGDNIDVEFLPAPVDFEQMFEGQTGAEEKIPEDVMYYSS